MRYEHGNDDANIVNDITIFVDDMIDLFNRLINIINQTVSNSDEIIRIFINPPVLIIAPRSLYCADMLRVDCKSVVMNMLRAGCPDRITKACEVVINRQGVGRGGKNVFL